MQARIDNLPPYLLGGIAEAVLHERREGKDVIDLSHVNPSFDPPPAAVESLVQASLLPHNHRYSSCRGIEKLREAAAEYYQERFSVALDAKTEICATMGTKEGLAHTLLALLSAGDNVIVPTPSYPVHTAAVFVAGANSIRLPLPLTKDGVLTSDHDTFFKELETACKSSWPQPRALLLSFPHNPTGITVEQSFFERLVEVAKQQKLLLLHDFAYADLCFDAYQAPSLLSVPGARELAVEFYSLSKSANIAGWRIGFCVGNKEIVGALNRIKSYLDFGSFQPLQIAAITAIGELKNIADENSARYQARRDVLVSGLQELGWSVINPRGALFVWAELPQALKKCGADVFCKELLEASAVAACPGVGFDSDATDKVRFALVESETRLREALSRISSFQLANQQ